jgi:hypothetical protein
VISFQQIIRTNDDDCETFTNLCQIRNPLLWSSFSNGKVFLSMERRLSLEFHWQREGTMLCLFDIVLTNKIHLKINVVIVAPS